MAKSDYVEKIINDIQENLRTAVMSGLEKGIPVWQMPWIGGSTRQKSYITGHPYHGDNAFFLSYIAWERGYTDNRWITYNHLTKGTDYEFKPSPDGEEGKTAASGHGVKIAMKYHPKKKDKDGNDVLDENGHPMYEKYWHYDSCVVFNVCLTTIPPEPVKECKFTTNLIGERMLENSPVPIRYGGNRAFYRPSSDEITLPPKENFLTTEGFYGTAFHEMVHSTMKEKRCNRKMEGGYAAEELVAETGSVILAGLLQVPLNCEIDNATAYILNWMQQATNEDFSKALYEAGKAARYLFNLYENGAIKLSVHRYGNIGPNTGLALLPVHDLVI